MPTAVKNVPTDSKALEKKVKEAVDFIAVLLDKRLAQNGLRLNLNSIRSDKLALAEYLIYKNKENVGFFKAIAFMPIMQTDDEGKMSIIDFELIFVILIKTTKLVNNEVLEDQKVAELKIEEEGTLEDQEEFTNKIYLQLLAKLGKLRMIE